MFLFFFLALEGGGVGGGDSVWIVNFIFEAEI